jgi:predicted nuclease with TOPRIM domain
MSDSHTCIRTEMFTDLTKRVGRLEDNDREDYGNRKEFAQALNNFGDTLTKINENLDSLNKKNDDTNKKIDNLEGRVNEKIETLEEKFESSEEKSKIDLREVAKEKGKMKLSTVGLSIAGLTGLLTILYEIAKSFHIIK